MSWINQWFSANAAQTGGVVRRKVASVHKYASRKLLLRAVRQRGWHLILNGDQYVVLCNKGNTRILR